MYVEHLMTDTWDITILRHITDIIVWTFARVFWMYNNISEVNFISIIIVCLRYVFIFKLWYGIQSKHGSYTMRYHYFTKTTAIFKYFYKLNRMFVASRHNYTTYKWEVHSYDWFEIWRSISTLYALYSSWKIINGDRYEFTVKYLRAQAMGCCK